MGRGLILGLAYCVSCNADPSAQSDASTVRDAAVAEVDRTTVDGATPDSAYTASDGALPDTSVADVRSRTDSAGGDTGSTAVRSVTTAAQLQQALRDAQPGTIIELQAGLYSGTFTVEVSGEAGREIIVRGPTDRTAILDGNGGGSAWQGILTLEGRHHLVLENLEIRNAPAERYGVLISAASTNANGCHDIVLRNLDVHDVGEEIIKIQGRNTHDILVEHCRVHTNQAWSGIDVQGHWGGTPPADQKPRRIVIRDNLVYDIPGFAGIGNEYADHVQALDNIILGSAMGLDIGCGDYNVVHNNLVATYAIFNALQLSSSYHALDLATYPAFSTQQIASFNRADCADGIALSGNYRALVYDNEITGCSGDLYLSYNHLASGAQHNAAHGHSENLFFRNWLHDNSAYRTIREYAKQAGGVSTDQRYFNNLFAKNASATDILFEHSEGLMFFNNTLVDGDHMSLLAQSTGAFVQSNLLFNSGYGASADSTGANVAGNCQTSSTTELANYGAGDYHLATGSGCASGGGSLQGTLTPVFAVYEALLTTEYAVRDDAPIVPAFFNDLDGVSWAASINPGAYAMTR